MKTLLSVISFLLLLAVSAQGLPSLEGVTSIDQRIRSLNGTTSYHDGPNCYNGAALSLGFVDTVRHLTAAELRFYLEYFCTPVESQRFGDVGVIQEGAFLVHAMIRWDENLYFQKDNYAGKLGGLMSQSYDFEFINPSTSRYLKGCEQNGECAYSHFRCQQPEKIAMGLRLCQSASIYKNANEIAIKIENMVLNKSRDVALQFKEIESMAQSSLSQIASIDPKDPCGLYYAVTWYSIIIQGHKMGRELNTTFSPAVRAQIREVIKELNQSLVGEKNKRILREMKY